MKTSVSNFLEFEIFLNTERVFDLFNLNKIAVFGSFSRGERFNDIDIYIEEEINDKQLILLKTTLEEKLGIPVDIMLKKYAEPLILHRALKDFKYATRH